MSVLELVSSMASALAWPFVAIAAVMFFGRDVRKWLKERPTKVRFGPVEAEWVRQAAITEASLDSADAPILDGGREGRRTVLADTLKPEAAEEPLVAVLKASSAGGRAAYEVGSGRSPGVRPPWVGRSCGPGEAARTDY